MLIDIAALIGSLVLMLGACAIFINAIECFGKKLNFHQGIVGSIFAAVGTALPETIIPILAISFTGTRDAHEVGIGAIAGAPFMLSTLALFVTGCAVIIFALFGKRAFSMDINAKIMSKDLLFFLIVYCIAIATTFVHQIVWLKDFIGICIFLSYFLYLKLVVGEDAEPMENTEPLYLSKYLRVPENVLFSIVQLAASLLIIVYGAHLFISYVQSLAFTIKISPLILSLIITPIATEMPEKFNSVLWIGRRKDTLALGNITGAMVFQSCIPVVFGMMFTDWNIHGITLVSAVLAILSGSLVFLWLRIRKSLSPYVLLTGGISYSIFIFFLFKDAN